MNTREPKMSRRSLIMMSVLACISWGGAAVAYFVRSYAVTDQPFPNPDMEYLTHWGPSQIWKDGLEVIVKGRLLSTYKDKYHLTAAAMLYDATDDEKSAKLQLRSGIFSINNNDISMRMPYTQSFTNNISGGKFNTSYYLLLIPKSVKNDDFSTLGQAEMLGAIVVEARGGPP